MTTFDYLMNDQTFLMGFLLGWVLAIGVAVFAAGLSTGKEARKLNQGGLYADRDR